MVPKCATILLLAGAIAVPRPAAGQVFVMPGRSDSLTSGPNFTDSLAPAPLNSLPEPAALLLLCCGAVILLVRPRRRPIERPPRVGPSSSRGPGRFSGQ